MKPSVVAISPVATTSKLSWIQNSEDMVDQPSYSETHKLAIRPASEMSMFLTTESPHFAEYEWANIHEYSPVEYALCGPRYANEPDKPDENFTPTH